MGRLSTADKHNRSNTSQQAHVCIDEEDHLLDIDTGNFSSLYIATDSVNTLAEAGVIQQDPGNRNTDQVD